MKVTEGSLGRIFVIRLEEGDRLPSCIEDFALRENVTVGFVTIIGGVHDGEIVVGPRNSRKMPPEPIILPVEEAYEAAGIGVIAPGEEGKPVLHLHTALGREGKTLTGCLRPGVHKWLVGEVILCEILGSSARRVKDNLSGFTLLNT